MDGTAAVTPARTEPRRGLVLAVIAIAQLMMVLDASVVVVALPSAQKALHIGVADRQWALSAYTLAFGSLLLLGGRIADLVGRRRMFILGLLGFAAASAVGGMAQDAAMLFTARAVQGAFGALMAPSALSILTVTFTEARERARAFGVYGAIAGGGAAIGLVLGGVLTQLASWRWTLLINVPIALVAAAAASRVVEESKGRRGAGYDLPGAAAVTAGLFFLVYGFTEAGQHGWTAPLTLAMFSASVVALAAFVAVESRSAHPLLPLGVVLDRNRGGAFTSSLLVGSALLGTFLLFTYYFQGTLHYSALRTGFAFLPFSVGIIIGASVSGRLLPRFGPRPLMSGGLLLGAVGLVLFTRVGLHASYLWPVLPAELIISVGMGTAFVPMSSTALVGVDPDHAGVASALVNTTQQAGGSLGTALLNTVAASATASYLAARGDARAAVPAAAVHGYTTAFTVSAALVLGAAALAAWLIRASRHDVQPDEQPAERLAIEPGPIDQGLVDATSPGF